MPVYIAVEQQEDGRWLADAVDYPGILTYGQTQSEACANLDALLFQALRDHAGSSEETLEAIIERNPIVLSEH